jgi:hypothetical protein
MRKVWIWVLITIILLAVFIPSAEAKRPPRPPFPFWSTSSCIWAYNRVTHHWDKLCLGPPIVPLPRDICDGCVGGG